MKAVNVLHRPHDAEGRDRGHAGDESEDAHGVFLSLYVFPTLASSASTNDCRRRTSFRRALDWSSCRAHGCPSTPPTRKGSRRRRTNVPEADVRGFYRQIGAASSHGFEMEVVGSVSRGLGIRAGYAWTDTEITRDTAGFTGRRAAECPAPQG